MKAIYFSMLFRIQLIFSCCSSLFHWWKSYLTNCCIIKCCRNLVNYEIWLVLCQFKIKVASFMSRASVFTSQMTVISRPLNFIIIFFVTNMAFLCFLKVIFIINGFLSLYLMVFQQYFTSSSFFHEFIMGIFSSVRLNWFCIFIM